MCKWILTALVVALLSSACYESVEIASSDVAPPKWDLVGTWSNLSEDNSSPDFTYTFRPDATFSTEQDGVPIEGTWSLKEDILTLSTTVSGVKDDGSGNSINCVDAQISVMTIAVVNDRLYRHTLNRLDTGEGGLDGLWRNVQGSFQSKIEGEISSVRATMQTVLIEISGDSFTAERVEKTKVEGSDENYFDTEREDLEGTVYREGNLVGIADSEAFPTGIPEDVSIAEYDDEFWSLGYRISSDVILHGIESAEQAAQVSYVKAN
jgi:hypothetical protein